MMGYWERKWERQKFLETATPHEIMKYWAEAQGRENQDQRLVALFRVHTSQRGYQPFFGFGNRINLPFLRLIHWLKFWFSEVQQQRFNAQVAETALAWKKHWRVDDPPVWRKDETK